MHTSRKTRKLSALQPPPGPWLALLRIPNLLTIPGDIAVGITTAVSTGQPGLDAVNIPFCIASSLLLYSAGLILNDYIDRFNDAVIKPDRPIPSGRINPAHALLAGIIFSLLALACAFTAGVNTGVISCIILATVLLYNLKTKKHPLAGSVTLGICRALNVLLGSSLISAGSASYCITDHTGLPWISMTAAAGMGLHVTAVSFFAEREDKSSVSALRACMPAVVLLGIFTVFALWRESYGMLFPALAAISTINSVHAGWYAFREQSAERTRSATGGMIRNLILCQAAICAAMGAILPATALATAWLGSVAIGRRISSS